VRAIVRLVLTGAAVIACSGTHGIFGQIASTTALVGTITDATGRSVPDASVTAVHTQTQDSLETTTNEEGLYTFQFVRIGTYELTVQRAGFQAHKATGITVSVNEVVRTDIVLQVGEMFQSVTVDGSPAPVKTDDASVSAIINMLDVANLPLNGRDPLRLAVSVAGVLPGLKPTNLVPPGQAFIGAGTREIQNSIALDGISIVNNMITTTSVRPMVGTRQWLNR
jgi:hypothetical protein